MGFDYYNIGEVHRLLGDLRAELGALGASQIDHHIQQREKNDWQDDTNKRVWVRLDAICESLAKLEKQETVNSGAITVQRAEYKDIVRSIDDIVRRLDRIESDTKVEQIVVDWQREARAEREAELRDDLMQARRLLAWAPRAIALFPDRQANYESWLRKVNAFLDRLYAKEKDK